MWEISSTVRDYQAERDVTPYRNRIIPETGTFEGIYNFRSRDQQQDVNNTEALHFSDILYSQIEMAKRLIRDQVSQLLQLKNHTIPEFDLKRYVSHDIANEETKDMIRIFFGESNSQHYNKGSDGFDAFADAPTTESKLRLAHRYNKDCTSIKIVKANNVMGQPSTEHLFSDRRAFQNWESLSQR
ncbi:MAG TPA: hypothetical protein VGL94_03315 [Ktedonobacteraceae bacterium]|jgi:hypothetical protein